MEKKLITPSSDCLESQSYIKYCDDEYKYDNLKHVPDSGIVQVHNDEISEFFNRCGDNGREYVIVSPRSDFGIAYQHEHSVWMDMHKAIKSIPYDHTVDLSQLGYRHFIVPPRCDVENCNQSDLFSVKCDSYTKSTFSDIPSNIRKWFTVNMMCKHPKIECIPFGIPSWSYEILDNINITEKRQDKSLYVNFQTYTVERLNIKSFYRDSNFAFCTYVDEAKDNEIYLNELSSHKFVLCPNGNGIDCFRTWEALTLGTIPIVERSYVSESFSDLPILIVDNMYGITKDFLDKQYELIMNRFPDWSTIEKLKLSYWGRVFSES